MTGDDVTVWVEIAFDGVGWVAFNPTPDETDIPQDQVPQPQSEPQPQVRQPPRAEKDDEKLLSPVELEETEDDDNGLAFVLPGWVIVLGLSLLIPAAIVFIPLLIIGAIKARRARKRRETGPGARPRRRCVGGTHRPVLRARVRRAVPSHARAGGRAA